VKTLIPAAIALAPITACLGWVYARWMLGHRIGQQIRELGPQGHAVKAGTPTMGGLLVLLTWGIAVAAHTSSAEWASPIGFVLAAAGLHGVLGLVDDVQSVRRRRSLGLSAPSKILLGTLAAVGLFFAFGDVLAVPQRIPFLSLELVLPPAATFALVWIALLATTNSMNLADGIDGLAGGLAVLILVGLLVLTPSRTAFVLIVPLLGVLLGFLWLNTHPAQLFLGDVGSFALGAIVAAVALATGTAFYLPLVAGVLVLESGSVILQILSCRVLGTRLFKMSPLHHHFEQSTTARSRHLLPGFEWPETAVATRFWLLQALFVGLACWAAYGG